MNLNKIQKELKKFDRYRFYEKEHRYAYVDDDEHEIEISTSVTSLIHQYVNPFNEEKAASIKSQKENIPKEEILKQWHLDNQFSRYKGTITHLYNENLWKGNTYQYDKESIIQEFGRDCIEPIWDSLKRISDSFYQKFHDHLIPIGLEQVVGSIDYDIAGTIDFLAYSKKLDSIIIIDYKTNKEIKRRSFQNQKMLFPFDNIIDSNYYHYSLQLATYKWILEKETNLKISSKKWLIWIHENNSDYKIYECVNLDEEVKKILEERRIKG